MKCARAYLGYVLSRAALRSLVEGHASEGEQQDGEANKRCNWNKSELNIRAEDVNIAICLKEVGVSINQKKS